VLWFILLLQSVNGYGYGDRILESEIDVLTLTKGKKTTGRRSDPIDQLNCVGGTARGNSKYYPGSVQCKNQGSDGYSTQWECKADLDEAVKFGSVSVNCEGYDYPEDPYILKGSCALEYSLDFTGKGQHSQSSSYGGYNDNSYYDYEGRSGWGTFLTFIILVFVIYNIFRACANSQANAATYGNAPGYGGPAPGYGGGYGSGSGYGGYGGGFGPGCAPSTTTAAPGGFWTGLATGGLLSYLFRPSYGGYRSSWGGMGGMRSYGGSYGGGGSGFFSGGGGGGSRMSSGFGGSTRR
jgi:cbb3-type cytochrome oxidase subunit 3